MQIRYLKIVEKSSKWDDRDKEWYDSSYTRGPFLQFKDDDGIWKYVPTKTIELKESDKYNKPEKYKKLVQSD